MSKYIDDKKHKEEYISSYHFSKKPYLLIQKNHIIAKKIHNSICYKIFG